MRRVLRSRVSILAGVVGVAALVVSFGASKVRAAGPVEYTWTLAALGQGGWIGGPLFNDGSVGGGGAFSANNGELLGIRSDQLDGGRKRRHHRVFRHHDSQGARRRAATVALCRTRGGHRDADSPRAARPGPHLQNHRDRLTRSIEMMGSLGAIDGSSLAPASG